MSEHSGASRPSHSEPIAAFLDHPVATLDLATMTGHPVVLTSYGSPKFLIVPVNEHTIINAGLTHGPIADEINRRAAEPDNASTYSVDELLAREQEEAGTT